MLATAMGLALVAVSPPFRWGDENTHFLRAVRLSEGELTPGCAGGSSKPNVPLGAIRIVLRFRFPPPGEARPSWRGLAAARQIELQPDRRYPIWLLRSPYSPLGYATQAAGVAAARLASSSALLALYAARIGNLLGWVGLVWLALCVAPGMRWATCAIALSPMAMYLAASSSVDATTNGSAILWTAYVLHVAATPGERIAGREILVLALLAASLALGKPVYAALIGLLWVVPTRRLGGPWRAIGLTTLLLGVAGGTAAAWAWSSGRECVDGLSIVDPATVAAHLRSLTSNPGAVLRLVARSANLQLHFLIGGLSQTEGHWPPVRPSSPWLLGAAVVIGWLFDPPLERGVSLRQRLVALGIAAAVFTALTIVAYVYWTPAGARTVHGSRIRYLIPLLPALLIALAPPRLGWPRVARTLAGSLVAVLCAAVLAQTVLRGLALFRP